ncbi:MAG: hypothetical protein HYY22_07565 [Thaumarchaeota archaeon]|nr:hypothetical protein [Nitrososphaerota archaeon]
MLPILPDHLLQKQLGSQAAPSQGERTTIRETASETARNIHTQIQASDLFTLTIISSIRNNLATPSTPSLEQTIKRSQLLHPHTSKPTCDSS